MISRPVDIFLTLLTDRYSAPARIDSEEDALAVLSDLASGSIFGVVCFDMLG